MNTESFEEMRVWCFWKKCTLDLQFKIESNWLSTALNKKLIDALKTHSDCLK